MWTWLQNDIPQPRTTISYQPSACANGGDKGPWAFACPHMALLSDDMLLAARRDGLDHDFLYGVAGSSSDKEAGKCYQVQPLYAEKQWRDDFPQLVVQIVNSGYDVMEGQFDIMVGAGGQGYFTAVNSDCKQHHCQGGSCRDYMFDGDFSAWTNAQYPDPNSKCYAGGVKHLFNVSENFLWEVCTRLSGGSNELKDRILWDTCVRSNQLYLHQNFYESRYLRVECPESLYRLTGLRRADDAEVRVYPNIGNPLPLHCKGSIESGHPCLSSMMDGCVPSASWSGKVDTVQGYPAVDRCDRNGNIL